jgi:peptidoglycan/xylan/chitin deacetylase (PgdA/CDA1 family)
MLKRVKRTVLSLASTAGVSALIGRSAWRKERLLILCYHGISRDEEHLWRPPLYMELSTFRERMELLVRNDCTILPLEEGIERLYQGELPQRSVAITFDDGGVDFYTEALPVLQEFGFPATVYLATYYSEKRLPIFHLLCSYMLWKRRGHSVALSGVMGGNAQRVTLDEPGIRHVVQELISFAESEQLSALEKDALAGRLASALGVDYGELRERRLFELLNPAEVAELAGQGVDFQLHTHRHRSPLDESAYRKELADNRACIQRATGRVPSAFCYPSGDYRTEFLPWLRAEGIASATTCVPALATSRVDPLLLPRLVDVGTLAHVEFEGWLTGTSAFLPQR